MKKFRLLIAIAFLFQIASNAIKLDIGESSSATFFPIQTQIFYISVESFPSGINEGSILIHNSTIDFKDSIEIKSNFVDEINETPPNEPNSLIIDTKNNLNEIIYKFPKNENRKKYFLFSLENKGTEELYLDITPLKFPQEFIISSKDTKKIELNFEMNIPQYYQLKFEFIDDIINAILYCEENNFLIINGEITQETIKTASNKIINAFEKDNNNQNLIIKIFNKEKEGKITFYFEFTNKKVFCSQNLIGKYYQTEFLPSDKGDIYLINIDDTITTKFILFKQIFGETFKTFYSSTAQIESDSLTLLPTEQDQDKEIPNEEYATFNSKFQILLIKHKKYGQAKYIFVNPSNKNLQAYSENFIYLEKDGSLTPTVQASAGINFRFLHLYGGKLSYKMDTYTLAYEEDSYGSYKSSFSCKFVIKAVDNCIVQLSFILGTVFKKVNENSIITTNLGVLVLLEQSKDYTTFKIIFEGKYEQSNEDVEIYYSKGSIEKEDAAPLPYYVTSKTFINKIEINTINPYLFSNYRINKDKYYYSFINMNTTTKKIFNVTIEYNRKSGDIEYILVNTINKIEKNKYYILEKPTYNNTYITYMLLSSSNSTKELTFGYYDIKLDTYLYTFFINFEQNLFDYSEYDNISIILDSEEDNEESIIYYYFNNETIDINLLNRFKEKINNFKFNYTINNAEVNWVEPIDDFKYNNLIIYIYDSEKNYNIFNFTEEEKKKAIKVENINMEQYSQNFDYLLKNKRYDFYILLEYKIEQIPIPILTSFSLKINDDGEEEEEKEKEEEKDKEKEKEGEKEKDKEKDKEGEKEKEKEGEKEKEKEKEGEKDKEKDEKKDEEKDEETEKDKDKEGEDKKEEENENEGEKKKEREKDKDKESDSDKENEGENEEKTDKEEKEQREGQQETEGEKRKGGSDDGGNGDDGSGGNNNGKGDNGTDTTTILLIVIPCSVALIVAIVLIIYFMRRRRQKGFDVKSGNLIPLTSMENS